MKSKASNFKLFGKRLCKCGHMFCGVAVSSKSLLRAPIARARSSTETWAVRPLEKRVATTAGVETVLHDRILALSAGQAGTQLIVRSEAAPTPIASVRHSLLSYWRRRNLTGCAPLVCPQYGFHGSITRTIILDEVQPRRQRRTALNKGISNEVAVVVDPLLSQVLR